MKHRKILYFVPLQTTVIRQTYMVLEEHNCHQIMRVKNAIIMRKFSNIKP